MHSKSSITLICIFKFQRTINKGICSISSDIIGDRYIQRRKRSVPVDVNVAALCILAHTLDHRNVMGGRAAYLREHLLIRDWPVGLHYTAVDVLKYIFHLSIPLLQTVNQVIRQTRVSYGLHIYLDMKVLGSIQDSMIHLCHESPDYGHRFRRDTSAPQITDTSLRNLLKINVKNSIQIPDLLNPSQSPRTQTSHPFSERSSGGNFLCCHDPQPHKLLCQFRRPFTPYHSPAADAHKPTSPSLALTVLEEVTLMPVRSAPASPSFCNRTTV